MNRKMKRILWEIFVIPTLGLVVFVVGAEGLRVMFPALAVKLSKVPVPGFDWLFSFEGLHRLDVAHISALVMFVFVWGSWCSFLRLYLHGKRSKWATGHAHDVIQFISFALLLFDGIVFYRGISETGGWGNAAFSIWPFIATCLYACLTVYAAFKTVELESEEQSCAT
jgi:hypothetical protein